MKRYIKRILQGIGAHVVRPYLPPPAPDSRTSAATKAAIASVTMELQGRARSSQHLPRLCDCGFRVFSQFEEDGYLVYLAAVLELEPKKFLDIGAADGINSNCANLALNLGWHGVFIESDHSKVEYGKNIYEVHPDTCLYPPKFKQAFVTAENINELVTDAGLSGNIGICSIDIDGNDCWAWKALEVVSPAVVIIETNIEFGMRNIAVPYDPNFRHSEKFPYYFGASALAMHSLATKKGYRLVGANRFGFNLIFVRNDVYPDRVPAVSIDSILLHPRYAERLKLCESIKDWEYVAL